MKNFIKALWLSLFLSIAGAAAANQQIELVSPYPPGGAVDIFARSLSKTLEANGFSNIVTYHPGADGDLAYKYTMTQKDQVIMLGAHANLVFSHVVRHRPNHHADNLLVVGPNLKAAQGFITGPKGFKDYKELIDTAKANELPCGVGNSAGNAELLKFNQEFKTKFVPVIYKGSGPVAIDLAGDHIQCAFESLPSYYTRHEVKQVKILSTSFANKVDVPLMSTQLPVDKSESWYGIALPKNGNLAQNEKLIKVLKEFGSNRADIQNLLDQGYVPAKIDPKINDDIRRQTDYYNSLMK
jgi:tripartite-type tricarboxylate transporter receptor subunit TctC